MTKFIRVSLLALAFGLPMVAIAPSDAEAARRSNSTSAQQASGSHGGTHARSSSRQHRQTSHRTQRRTRSAAPTQG